MRRLVSLGSWSVAACFALGSAVTACGGITRTTANDGTSGSGDGGTNLTSGGCHTSAECDQRHGGDIAWYCQAYTLEPLCGGKYDNTFANDCVTNADCADAGADFICDSQLCVFPHGGAQVPLHCRKGCDTNADCGPGLACAAHECRVATCTTSSTCGPDFTCQSGKCAAAPCTSDADCHGYCVDGACSVTLGTCEEAVP